MIDASGASRTVLFVDDEVSLVELANYVLGQAGWKLIPAYDGRKALAIFQRAHDDIDVVVLDLVIPGIPGPSVLEQMNRIDDTVPVIVATGMERDQVFKKLNGRTPHILTKPYNLSALSTSLENILVQSATM